MFAHRLAHTLKGNAGQIGEKILQSAAAAVETMLTRGKKPFDVEKMANLEAELRLVLEKLEPLTQANNVINRLEINNPEEIRTIIAELELTLIENETSSRKLLDKLWAIPGAEVLAQLIDDFEFNLAREEFAKFKEIMNNPQDR